MAKREIEKVNAPANVVKGAMPAHLMRQDKPVGTEGLKEYVVLPRLKVVQKSAGDDVRKVGGTGDFILSPLGIMLAAIGRDTKGNPQPSGPPIFFTPLFFFPDWATWNPIELKGKEPAIAYRTSDRKDAIVAKSQHKDLRLEPLLGADGKQLVVNGKPLFKRHVEHLNFVVAPYEHDTVKDPFIITFAKGEHFSGKKFAGLIRMRNADLFGCRFQANASFRPSKGQGDWYGIDVANPTEESGVDQWVSDPDEYEKYKQLYEGFKEIFSTKGLQADMSDAEDLVDEAGAPVDPATRTM